MVRSFLGIYMVVFLITGSAPFGFSEPLRVQLEQGIETGQLQCDNPNHVLVQCTNGNVACVTEKNAERTGWEIIKPISNINNVLEEFTVDESDEPLVDIIYGTTTVVANNEGNTAAMASICSLYPKNLIIEYPNAVTVNQEFDITVSYTNIVWYDKHVAESELSGVPLAVEDAKERLEEARPGCDDTRIWIIAAEKLNVLNQNTVLEGDYTISKTGKVSNTWYEQFDFNSIEPQTQTLTMQYTELPDRFDTIMQIGTQGNLIDIYHYVDNDTIYLSYIHPKSTDSEITTFASEVQIIGEALQSVMSSDDIASSDFYTEPVELTPIQVGTATSGNKTESPPPMESLAEFIENNVKTDDLRGWLENEGLPLDYIEDLLSQFPDLAAMVANFIFSLMFNIPEDNAEPASTVYIYGYLSYYDSESNSYVYPEEVLCNLRDESSLD